MGYKVDITKPPLSPPSRIFKEGLFSSKETKESCERTEAWNEYIKLYDEAIDKQKERKQNGKQ